MEDLSDTIIKYKPVSTPAWKQITVPLWLYIVANAALIVGMTMIALGLGNGGPDLEFARKGLWVILGGTLLSVFGWAVSSRSSGH